MTNSSFHSYAFDSMSRIGNDDPSIDQRNIQNKANIGYTLENFYQSCPMETAQNFALKQPNVFYRGSHEGGINGCVVDQNTELKHTILSKPACKLTLETRPFITVPYLGRGEADPELELQIRTGENFLNKKTVNNTTETSFIDYKNYPLLESLKNTVTNPQNLIENDAYNGWVRGGMSAREYARNQNNKH
jgi:hypothetical protein